MCIYIYVCVYRPNGNLVLSTCPCGPVCTVHVRVCECDLKRNLSMSPVNFWRDSARDARSKSAARSCSCSCGVCGVLLLEMRALRA